MKLKINEIFHSIQGESIYSGIPCIFIRLSGCNLRCLYCDTVYAYDEGVFMTIQSIVDTVNKIGCKTVEITGGEPLAQPGTIQLIKSLIDNGYIVLLETNGSISTIDIDYRCIKIIDIKCPSSGESLKNRYDNIHLMNREDQLKFVISDKIDFEFAKDIIDKHHPPVSIGNILFSPVSGLLSPDILARWILQDKLNVRLHLQLHKFIWPDIKRGV